MDPIYYTDDYPRNGCRIEIRVPDDGCAGSGWSVSISHPNRKKPPMEIYGPQNLDGALLVARCLATGKRVPLDYQYGKPSGRAAIERQHDRMQANNDRMFGASKITHQDIHQSPR